MNAHAVSCARRRRRLRSGRAGETASADGATSPASSRTVTLDVVCVAVI
jgi:hypothetical protein